MRGSPDESTAALDKTGWLRRCRIDRQGMAREQYVAFHGRIPGRRRISGNGYPAAEECLLGTGYGSECSRPCYKLQHLRHGGDLEDRAGQSGEQRFASTCDLLV